MTWPTTKASNQHTDNATDSIANARVDINQNITNVNLIIDHLDISTPNDGDVMQYNATSGVWESVDVENISSTKIAVLTNTGVTIPSPTIPTPSYVWNLSQVSDIYGILTVDTQTKIVTLQPGTYLFENHYGSAPGSTTIFQFYENDISILTFTWNQNLTIPEEPFMFVRTITEPAEYRLRADIPGGSEINTKITKL